MMETWSIKITIVYSKQKKFKIIYSKKNWNSILNFYFNISLFFYFAITGKILYSDKWLGVLIQAITNKMWRVIINQLRPESGGTDHAVATLPELRESNEIVVATWELWKPNRQVGKTGSWYNGAMPMLMKYKPNWIIIR